MIKKCKREEKEKQDLSKQKIQMAHKKRRETIKLSVNKHIQMINEYTTDKLITELNAVKIKLIKNDIITLNLCLNNYKIYIPDDIINYIINFSRPRITEIPNIFELIPKDIYSYSKKKYRDKNIDSQLVLKYFIYYHTMIFIRKIIELKEDYINYY